MTMAPFSALPLLKTKRLPMRFDTLPPVHIFSDHGRIEGRFYTRTGTC
jgi:hypothetical protein